MAAAEVDGFPYGKYSLEERRGHRSAFYEKFLSPQVPVCPALLIARDDTRGVIVTVYDAAVVVTAAVAGATDGGGGGETSGSLGRRRRGRP